MTIHPYAGDRTDEALSKDRFGGSIQLILQDAERPGASLTRAVPLEVIQLAQ